MTPLPTTHSVKEVAESYGASPDKVIGWIRSGKLTALNVGNGAVKPRWRIRPADLAEFERARESKKTPKPTRRRRKDSTITEYF